MGCFLNYIIHWISNYPVDSAMHLLSIGRVKWETNWKKLSWQMQSALGDKNTKRFTLEFFWLIGHSINEQLWLLKIFSNNNLLSVPSNPFLSKPHFFFVLIYYSESLKFYFPCDACLQCHDTFETYFTLHRKLQRVQMWIMIGILTEVCLSHIYDFCL